MFSSVFCGAGASGVAKAIYTQFCLSHLACAAGFNNMIIILILHDFLPPMRRGSRVKSDNTHNHSTYTH